MGMGGCVYLESTNQRSCFGQKTDRYSNLAPSWLELATWLFKCGDAMLVVWLTMTITT
jgi:hypothetical protein